MATEIQNARLAALILADEAISTPLVLGKSLTELQIARVVSAGARHVVCLVRQVSSQILVAADNLRANGLSIDIVRTVAEAADAIHPEEAVFLVSSQVLASVKTLGDLTKSGIPSLLCVETEAAPAQFEIVDASMRWTGYALLEGAALRRVAGMVGDWDAASTLLRQMVQDNARRVVLGRDQLADAMINVRTNAEAVDAGRKLLNENSDQHGGLGMYWLGRPVSRFLARLAGELGVKSKVVKWSAVGAALIGAVIGLVGWLTTALLILLLAVFANSAAVRLTAALGELDSNENAMRLAIRAATIVTVCSVAVTLASRTGQWGCLILGGLLIGSHVLMGQNQAVPARPQRWIADPLSGIAILFAGFMIALPVGGLLLAAGHAVGSFLWKQRPSSNVVFNQA
ncbi:hypothetical protein BH09PSE3_BH09PSE3_06300 [soil metagenome]